MANELGDLIKRATTNLVLEPDASAAVIDRFRRIRRRRLAAAGALAAAGLAAAIVVPLTANSGAVQRIVPVGPVTTSPTAQPGRPSPTSPALPPRTGRSASVSAAPSQTPSAVTSSPPAAVSACTFADLRVTLGQGFAATGHSSFPIIFHNTGGVTCTLQGYPGVAGLNEAGQQIVQAQRTPSGSAGGLKSGGSTPVVALSPGGEAAALVEGRNFPEGGNSSCHGISGLLVTPPDTFQSVHVSAGFNGCAGLQIHPVLPGVMGSGSS